MNIPEHTMKRYRDFGLIKQLGASATTKNDQYALDYSTTTTLTVKIDKAASTDNVRSALRDILAIGERCGHEFDCCGCYFNSLLKVKRTKRGEAFVTFCSSRNC